MVRMQQPTRPDRSGITLAEVLISMGILTVGLLGAASLFPVGGHYMQQGDIADRANAIAQAALDDAIVRGHLDPGNWTALDIDVIKNGTTVVPASMRNALIGSRTLNATASTMAGNLGEQYTSGMYGAAYVIDPLGLAAGFDIPTAGGAPFQDMNQSQTRRRFPATSGEVDYQVVDANRASWFPWDLRPNLATWPVRRVTTTISAADWNTRSFRYQQPTAEALFTGSDDLAVLLPESEDNPSKTRWQTWSDGASVFPSSRQTRGDYSWLITVSPGSAEARDALATQPDAYPYDVSVVVFHRRVLGIDADGALEAERLVNARVVSTGTAGGELLLDRRPTSEDSVEASPFEDLRSGQYVMLCGPHPLSTQNNPVFFLQWYRVLNIEDSGRPLLDGSGDRYRLNRDGDDARVLVSLRGPDWPWRPVAQTDPPGELSETNLLPNDLRVAIIPGAVAVHTKTMRLEAGSAWSID